MHAYTYSDYTDIQPPQFCVKRCVTMETTHLGRRMYHGGGVYVDIPDNFWFSFAVGSQTVGMTAMVDLQVVSVCIHGSTEVHK